MLSYLLLSSSAFAAQALLFVPIVPLLLGSGALAARGSLSTVGALTALLVGVAAGDFFWFAAGRRGGRRVLSRICRLALEPATCLRRTENIFGRYGAAALLVAKFIPGLSTVALPLAGVFRMRPRRFLLYDVPGVLLWVSTYVALGYLSAGHVATLVSLAPWSGRTWLAIAAGSLALYLAVKQWRRRRLLRQLRVDRISVGELHRRMDAGDPLCVIDLRHPVDFESDPYTIPHALYIPAEALDAHMSEVPRDRDVVLYCTCPDEITSARQALRLRRRGVRRVRPLQGGLSAWRAAAFPLVFRGPAVPEDERMLNAA